MRGAVGGGIDTHNVPQSSSSRVSQMVEVHRKRNIEREGDRERENDRTRERDRESSRERENLDWTVGARALSNVLSHVLSSSYTHAVTQSKTILCAGVSLNTTPYTLHPTPYSSLYTLHLIPYTLQPTPYTLHPTP